jgi:hypothetical protein
VEGGPLSPALSALGATQLASDVHGIKLTKGTQYWIVAQTNETDEHTRMECYLSPLNIEGNFAFNNGQGWSEFTAFRSAFAVCGKRIN